MARSLAEIFAKQPDDVRKEWLSRLTPQELAVLKYRWDFYARPEQKAPPGDWGTWLILSGRSWGKTRTGSEWIRSCVCGDTPHTCGPRRDQFIAIVAETASDARDVLVEGPAGLLRCHPPDHRPVYEPSKRRLTWPNGAIATLYNGTEPDQLRGPQHSLAWCDELAKWRYAQEAWDMLEFGMRLGDDPRKLITTTPRPIKIIKALMDDPSTFVTRGSLFENRGNLPDKFVKGIQDRYGGTRLGRQELDGEILDDVPGALWTRATLDRKRRKWSDDIPPMQRIVVAIDPAAKPSEDDDENSETGIIVAGIGTDGQGYVIDDRSCRLGPNEWARLAVAAYDKYEADLIVAEVNNGGAMVEQVIKAVRNSIKVESVHATRGKVVRAEPVSALYEQGRISHIGNFPALEDQLVQFTPFGIEGDAGSDRADALVWALTKLFPALVSKERRIRQHRSYYNGHDRSDTTGY